VRLLDLLLLLVGTPLLVAGLALGVATAEDPPVAPPPRGADGGLPEGLDPGALNLPDGVGLDPQTLRLVGLDLQPFPGSELLAWETLLGYEYQEGLEGLPEAVKALDGKRVTMAGFLLTLYEFDDIKDFSLVASHWSCCFGMPPGLNGWVHVTLAAGQAGLPNTAEPIKIAGTFRVREEQEAGYVVSIYGLEDAEARIIGW
jgi:hypothetical protein